MKILFVTPYFYPQLGGLEQYAFAVAFGLLKKYKDECIIITSGTEKKIIKEHINGLTIYRLPIWIKLSNTPINPLWAGHIKDILVHEQPDIINAHSPVPFIADCSFLVKGKIPFVLTYHAGSMKKNSLIPDMLISLYESFVLPNIVKNSKAVVATSSEFLQKTIQPLNAHSFLIPPGIDQTLFKPQKNAKRQHVLYVGKIDTTAQWKGVDILLHAIEKLQQTHPTISLHLVGEGNEINYYQDHARSMGIEKNITFLGKLTGQDLVKEYQSAQVLVLPSTTEAESFGIVLIEAMACNTPVIGSNIGGIPYVIDDNKTGLLATPNDPDDLAEKIELLLHNKKLTEKLSTAAFKNVTQQFTVEKQIETYHNVLKKVYETN